MSIRDLTREQVEEIWVIDRTETIDQVYRLVDGRLELHEEHHETRDWPDGEAERYGPILLDCFDRGGTFRGAFDGDDLVGAAVLECRFIGSNADRLQLKFFHVSHDARRRGIGRTLFDEVVERARALDARALYISATPSAKTVDFYLRRGCRLTMELDPELFALEPEDIHLELDLVRRPGREERHDA